MTKVFTALLLADLAERGQVRLSDPAARYLPGGTGPVTLADLATHTSGLPRLPSGMRWSALARPRDPYAGYPPEIGRSHDLTPLTTRHRVSPSVVGN